LDLAIRVEKDDCVRRAPAMEAMESPPKRPTSTTMVT
jgi:hypothetical protein